jgi:hypothetical protein
MECFARSAEKAVKRVGAVQTLLRVFSAKGVLLLEFKPVHSRGGLHIQHLDELKQESEHKGGVLQTLMDHFVTVYKVSLGLAA